MLKHAFLFQTSAGNNTVWNDRLFVFSKPLSPSRQSPSHCIPTHSVGQGLVLPSSDLRYSFPIVPRGGSTIQKHWNVEFARQQVAEFLCTGYTFFHCYIPDRNEGADIHRTKAWVLPCNSVNKTITCEYWHGYIASGGEACNTR